MQGTCCPKQAVCGDQCCPDGGVCVNGQCCSKEDSYGVVCCNAISPTGEPNFDPYHCANPARSLCYPHGEVDVGAQCCKSGQVLIDEVCCKPGGKLCGDGKCCVGECKPDGTCKFNRTDAECQAQGSSACEACEEGCCLFIPR